MGSFLRLLSLCVLLCCGIAVAGDSTITPRLKLSYQDLSRHGLRTYTVERSCCFDTLLLDEERGRLFVGAKNYLMSLSLEDISKNDLMIYWQAPVDWREECNWAGKDINTDCMNYVKILQPYNRTHLYACGTGAFHPTCAYVHVGQRTEDTVLKLDMRKLEDGKGRCPYDPKHAGAAVLIGEELFSGVATDLMGRDFTIFRSLGRRPPLRTEQHDSRWLNEPKFVKVSWIPESENPDDDKIYFFFRETPVEGLGGVKQSYARIGQICRNDMGGQRSLVNKWTTFLKARLMCSVPGNDTGEDTHFDELRDVFVLQTRDRRNPLIYALFSTSSSVFRGAAVCVYTMNDVRRAFLGPFAHKEGINYQWVSYQGRVPYPRPGMCPSKTYGNLESTKSFPDDVLQFARNHPLMYNPVTPGSGRPVFLRSHGDISFTRLTVDRVTATDGDYDVMFIGTDRGSVLKVISVPKQSWHHMEELVLEELQVFKDASPVTSMQISSKRQQLYVGSAKGVSQLPLHRCGIYGKACAECCLARDPYCAWDGASCTRYLPNTKRRSRRQDVRNGDPNTLCSGEQQRFSVQEKRLFGVEGSSVFLECLPKSLRAQVTWTHQKSPDTPRKEVQFDERVIQTDRGILLRTTMRRDAGTFLCHSSEHGFTQALLRIVLEVIPSSRAEDVPGLHRTPPLRWYQDFLRLVQQPGSAEQMCEDLWARKGRIQQAPDPQGYSNNPGPQNSHPRPLPPISIKAKAQKWKHLEDKRKVRSRRTNDHNRADRGPRSIPS
ncbi:semaphorin-3B [Bombina bombina]|uniref:semaphorin-3B n=1 Tax=Bombina bombina TaxID=8345 RepID=UPI00235AA7D1|nr:semaphorin-3B [Bombina bombina]XP_053577144.1 semaphorin-3B [Bombina bombina]XP_053577145.1 semaphorin-3B [Bombina bombina]XP_053577146.1 semaphorin-3B [Bombina bombina]XP_053577147.1 semaphorin-3B [Bombina bombina]XP_053577148.1 semaphorin-3B [Bombina bombina]